jgi:hypothetical protein
MLMMLPDLYALSNGAIGFPASPVQHAEIQVEGKYSSGESFYPFSCTYY